jgi:hypothetical protein
VKHSNMEHRLVRLWTSNLFLLKAL